MLKCSKAILLASVMGLGSAMADGAVKPSAPSLKINGYTNVGVIAGKQNFKGTGKNDKGGSPAHIQMNCSELGFVVSGMSSSGVEYKYRVVLDAFPKSSVTVTKNYVEFGGDFGVIQAGSLKGPEDTMVFNALSLVGGGGGIDGAYPSVYNLSAGVIDGIYQAGYSNKANKIAMYSPIVSGFQLGVAYTPETTTYGGQVDKNSNNYTSAGGTSAVYPGAGDKAPRGRNNVSVGLKYKGDTGAWNYGGAVVYIREKTYMKRGSTFMNYNMKSANTYSLSAFFGHDAWKVAGGWFDNGKSRLPRDPNITYASKDGGTVNLGNTNQGDAGKAWNVGGQYALGAYEMAVTYFNTCRKTDATQKAKSDVVTLSLDYKALEGLKFFGEVDVIKSKTNAGSVAIAQQALPSNTTAVGNNSGTIMVAGTKLSF